LRTAAALVTGLLLAGATLAQADTNPDPTDVSGSLIAGGELSGTVAISFLVDPSSTYTGTISVDGKPIVNAAITQGSAILELDTTALLDGSHAVLVTVAGGGSTATVWSGTIETQNAPRGGVPVISGTPAVGSTLTASAGSWSPAPSAITYQWERCSTATCAPISGANGASYELAAADAGAEIEVIVSASDKNGTTLATSAPTPAIASSAAAADASTAAIACTNPQLSAALDGRATQTVALGEGATIEGKLSCGSTPVAGATLDLAISTPGAGASASYATVQTAADGSFGYTLPAGPSRDVTLSYRSSSAELQPQATATVALLVKPRITLEITPRATSNHHTITFSGRVLGGQIGHAGLPLQLEYREGERWMIYTDIIAAPKTGRFLYRYTFERTTESITYRFRVAIPATGVAGYPYQPVASAPRSVHVSP
jgi:hypothetical protein